MSSPTTNYLLQKPTVGGDTDAWGPYLNQNPDYLETYLGLPRVTYADAGSKSGAVSINAATANYQRITLTGNLTSLAFTNWPTVPTSNGYAIRIDVVQGGTGSYTAVLGSSFKTPGGDGLGTITLSSAVGARDVVCITSYNGTTFDVFVTNNMA